MLIFMANRDRFECNSCGYKWMTKKDWGQPNFCPGCKGKEFVNVDEVERKKMEEGWRYGWKKKGPGRVKVEVELQKFLSRLRGKK
jgi:hypothetical protein